jgi:hypothetical protein
MVHGKNSVPFASGLIAALAVVVMVVSGCDLDVVPNRDSVPPMSSISGTIAIDGAVTGDVVLLLYLCDEPPPPQGSAKPMDFILVPMTEFVGGSAEYLFPSIDPGADATDTGDALATCYLLSGFMDADHDWTAFYDVAGQHTGGDLMATPVEVEVYGAEVGGFPEPVTDVTIHMENPILFDRPVFQMTLTHTSTGAQGFEDKCGVELEKPGPLTYQVGKQSDLAAPYDLACADMVILPITTEVTNQDNPMFQIVFEADGDGDGMPDDVNGDGIAWDIKYPKILFVRLDPLDETKLSRAPGTVILPGITFPFDPKDLANMDSNIQAAYNASGLPFDGESSIYTPQIKFALPELVVVNPYVIPPETVLITEFAETGTPYLGEYQINVVQANGQIWYTPNLLMGYGVEGQDQVLTVTE